MGHDGVVRRPRACGQISHIPARAGFVLWSAKSTVLTNSLRVDHVGRPWDELKPLQGGFVDGSPISGYVLSEQGWESWVHVFRFADSDGHDVSEYG